MKIFVAIPLLREYENLPVLFECINKQTYRNFECVVCVNQPDFWWNDTQKIESCLDNAQSLDFCRSYKGFPVHVIDHSSKGNGWTPKKKGVGWARKTIFDFIAQKGEKHDLVISLDADTIFNENYFASVVEAFSTNPKVLAASIPYSHRLSNEEGLNRSMLRYEIYMRYYFLNLFRIKSPYTFTALGSALAFPLWAYNKIGGMTPVESGEDFYFLQKFAKIGKLLRWTNEKVFPAARKSDRVIFGTGPALIKPFLDMSETYPIYDCRSFDKIAETYSLFPVLFEKDVDTPLTAFLQSQLKTNDLWEPLRKNFKTQETFVAACHQRLDGLRILQYLRQNQPENKSDEDHFQYFAEQYPETELLKYLPETFCFETMPLSEMEVLRNSLEKLEDECRKKPFN